METIPADAEWGGESLALEPVDEVSVLTVCDNTVDILLVDQGPAKRLPLAGALTGAGVPRLAAPSLNEGNVVDARLAEHGFSTLVEVRKGGAVHRLLFDTGLTPTGCIDNLRRLGHDPGDIEAIVCGHGHFDHTTGLSGLIDQLGRTNLPVLIHPEFWTHRRLAIPGVDPVELPTTSRRALEDAGFDIIENQRPSFLFERSVLITGEVDRTTSFEQGFAIHQAHRDGRWETDPLILDDQALILHVKGKGLLVLTGCGHAGVINICHYAQRLTGIDRLHCIMGGVHLNGPLFEPIIDKTISAFETLAPDVIVPSHCTGWKAVHSIARRFPDAYIQNSVGTTFQLTSGRGLTPVRRREARRRRVWLRRPPGRRRRGVRNGQTQGRPLTASLSVSNVQRRSRPTH